MFILLISSVFICITGLFVLAVYLKNPSIIDAYWAVGIAFISSFFYLNSGLNWWHHLLFLMIVLWALRLSGFIFLTRVIKNKKDRRYETLLRSNTAYNKVRMAWHYYFQGLLQLSMCPLFLIGFGHYSRPGFLFFVGISLSLAGIIGEAIADQTAFHYKKNHTDICRMGLWKYSRHPNYFFEIVVWVGLALSVQHSAYSLIAFSAPLIVVIIFKFMSGPYSEKLSLQKHGQAYLDYQKSTPMIFPFAHTL